MITLLIGAAVAASPATAATAATAASPAMADFDLAKVKPREETCADRTTFDEVVVCAPKNMNPWMGDASQFAAKPVRATFSGPLRVETSIHVIQQSSPFGSSAAPAITLKWHF